MVNERTQKAHKEVTEVLTDYQTGSIQQTVKITSKNVGVEPNFVKLYLQDCLYLSNLPKGLNSILYGLIKRMDYDNEIVVNSAVKRKIANEVGLAFATVNGAITDFVKADILIRKDIGIYTVNPYLFAKGEWKEISKIRMTVEYTIAGRKFNTVIEQKENEIVE